MKKKKPPDKTRPPLSREQLLNGDKECQRNARRLISDAQFLGAHKRYRAGYLMALHASEELGKSIWLRLGRTIDSGKWGWWWKMFYKHEHKQASAILAWAAVHRAEEYDQNWRAVHKRIDGAAKNVFTERNKAMYVDFDKNNNLLPVNEDAEMEKAFTEEIEFAKWLSEWLASH